MDEISEVNRFQKYKTKGSNDNFKSKMNKKGRPHDFKSGCKRNGFMKSSNQHIQRQFNQHNVEVNSDTSIDDDTFHYFKRVAYQLQETFPTSEYREIFIENALEQTKRKELKLSCNKITSYVVQLLLEETKDVEAVKRFMKAFQTQLSDMCFHHCGSHLVQCLLYVALRMLKTVPVESDIETTSEKSSPNKNDQAFLISWVLEVGNFCFDALPDLLWDTFGSHILRTLLEVLGGKRVDQTIVRSKKSHQLRKETISNIPELLSEEKDLKQLQIPAFSELLGKFVDQLSQETNLTDWLVDIHSSAYLQTMVLVMKNGNNAAWKKLMKLVTTHIFPNDATELPLALTTESGTHLAEKVIEAADKKHLTKIWNQCLKTCVWKLSQHHLGNHVLQKFITSLKDNALFEEVFSNLVVHLEKFMASRYPGILKCIAETCVRLNSQQGQFMKGIMEALHCYEPVTRQNYLVPLLLHLTSYEKYDAALKEGTHSKLQVSIIGSVILQHISVFLKPIKVVKSILALHPDQLKALICDAKGSHAFDAFIRSPHVGEKNREKFIQHIKTQLFSITCDKYGSRFMDNLWDVIKMHQKYLIVEELVKNESRLVGNYYGKFFATKCSLYHFRHRLEQWKQLQNGKGSKRSLKELELTQPSSKISRS